jgi:hypothetical protein
MKILFRDCIVKRNENLCKIYIDSKFCHNEKSIQSTMLSHCNMQICTWAFPEGKNHSRIKDVLTHSKWHSVVLDIQYFRGAD